MVGAGLFSLYLAHHTKMIVAGKHAKYQINDRDYVLGASTYRRIVHCAGIHGCDHGLKRGNYRLTPALFCKTVVL
jgi:hypothetical protein